MTIEESKTLRKGSHVYVCKMDMQRAQELVACGRLRASEVAECAGVLAAMRRLQQKAGPGHKPLETAASLLPQRYVQNWARERVAMAGGG